MSEWSPGQVRALRAVADWYRNDAPNGKQVFRLFGYAGSGKTTLAKEIDEALTNGQSSFMTFTGKAASVLKSKGCLNATTIHSQIYTPKEKSRQRLRDLEAVHARILADRESCKIPVDLANRELKKVERDLEAERINSQRPMWQVNPLADVKDKPLFIIDEVSMVGEKEGEDLLSYGVPILVLGDPAQLPPVGGGGFFTKQKPDVMLTEIHRQAKDDPIIHLATTVREGGNLKKGSYGLSKVVSKKDLDRETVTSANQLLVGLNISRRKFNQRIRDLRAVQGVFPKEGERVVCLRNDRELGLLNGVVYNVAVDCAEGDMDRVDLSLMSDEGQPISCEAHSAVFEGREVPYYEKKEAQEFDYGYALTVHKSQGSQWDSVVLFDEWTRDARANWLYTGITRAAKQLTVVQDMFE